ncbi:energy transducer TonB [Rhizobium sp. SSA_523]|uniref:energy transducer TonB family protein n=1 Tax=Rhizobium sp. SSA_523 TaxID=2952477 RepID=UPI0020912DFD|nr:TonB family protein [Rhizobium sp. SSA_523]MCO5732889.1 TonB C-terminal domain-containing protein [Rhizobium sp. SSA_523]WKC23494.1 TonB family protein [Rhizobium sp. SSA_523]
MTPLEKSRRARLGEGALWTGACLAVLTAHLAAAAVMLRQEPIEAADAAPPAAIMIELAPEPEAAAVDETVVSEELQDSQEVVSETTTPVEEPPPEPVPEPTPEPLPEPPKEVVEPPPEPPVPEEEVTPEEVVEPPAPTVPEQPPEPKPEPEPQPEAVEQLTLLDNVEVPLPTVRPPVVEEPKEQKKEEPKPVRRKVVERKAAKPPAPAAKAAEQAKAQVRQSDRTAAAANSRSASGSSISPARWQSKLASHLARQRGRCPAAGRGSTAYVTFRIDGSGNLSGVSLSRSSGFDDFDRYMVDLVRRASPVPPPPPGISGRVTVPLGYRNC